MIRQRRRWWQRQLMNYSGRNSFRCAQDVITNSGYENHSETYAKGNNSEGAFDLICL